MNSPNGRPWKRRLCLSQVWRLHSGSGMRRLVRHRGIRSVSLVSGEGWHGLRIRVVFHIRICIVRNDDRHTSFWRIHKSWVQICVAQSGHGGSAGPRSLLWAERALAGIVLRARKLKRTFHADGRTFGRFALLLSWLLGQLFGCFTCIAPFRADTFATGLVLQTAVRTIRVVVNQTLRVSELCKIRMRRLISPRTSAAVPVAKVRERRLDTSDYGLSQ